MLSIAIIRANLKTSPLGTSSRLTEHLCGRPVLERTLERVARSRKLDEIVVICPSDQYDEVCGLTGDMQLAVRKFDGPEYPTQRSVLTARKWSLTSWRGGLANTCFFDEHTHPALCLTIARQIKADAVVSLPAEASLVDPQLLDHMLEHLEQQEDMPLVFMQAPPGVAPTVFRPVLLEEVAGANLSPGWFNSYRPAQPRNDVITTPGCYRSSLEIQNAAGRVCSDTRRGFELLQSLLSDGGESIDADQICRQLTSRQHAECESFPREVQIELTTEDQQSDTLLRPRGKLVPRRGPLDISIFDSLVEQLAQYDDTLLVFGGFGEPLLHPEFCRFLEIARRANLFGLAVRTNGIALSEEIRQALIDCQVDIVQVMLDANTKEQYKKVHNCDHWEQVVANMNRLIKTRDAQGKLKPLLPVSMVKSRETFSDQDTFFDRWLEFSGSAMIEGYSHHAGLLADRMVMNMAAPNREPCRQLRDRLTVLSNGQVVGCDQDFRGLFVAGDLHHNKLTEIWQGTKLRSLREAHQSGNYNIHPMCNRCVEWHRP